MEEWEAKLLIVAARWGCANKHDNRGILAEPNSDGAHCNVHSP